MFQEPTNPTLSAREAAELLGVSRWAIYDAVNRGDLQAVRVGTRIRVATAPLLASLGLTTSNSDTSN
jgi:excisionase family DNA binding protein